MGSTLNDSSYLTSAQEAMMAAQSNRGYAAAIMLMAAFLLISAPTLFSACQPPVSDEAIVSVEGRVLDVDGTPMTNVTVRLVKTDVNVLDADWVVGHIANTDKKPFREAETDENGEYYIEFLGADANAGNQLWAAYFVAYVIHPDDPDSHMAVASDSFQFSNQALSKSVPDLQLWDLPADGVVIDEEFVTISFEDSPVAPATGRYIIHIEGTEWTAEADGTTYQIPLTALEPCLAPIVDDPATCEPKGDHRLQVIALADGIRFRTAWHSFHAENPQGPGLWYRNPDDNTSGRTCSGKVLFDLNDGKFSGANSVQVLDQGMTAEDFRCITIDLQQEVQLDEVFLHNAAVWFHKDARIKFQIAATEEPVEADWTELREVDGAENTYPMMNVHLAAIDAPARHLRIKFVDIGDKPFWQRIGEISIYGTPNQAE
jgi:hypothetical protein